MIRKTFALFGVLLLAVAPGTFADDQRCEGPDTRSSVSGQEWETVFREMGETLYEQPQTRDDGVCVQSFLIEHFLVSVASTTEAATGSVRFERTIFVISPILDDQRRRKAYLLFRLDHSNRSATIDASGDVRIYMPDEEYDEVWSALSDPLNTYRWLQIRKYQNGHVWAEVQIGR